MKKRVKYRQMKQNKDVMRYHYAQYVFDIDLKFPPYIISAKLVKN